MLRLPGEFVSSPEVVNNNSNTMSTFVSSFQNLMRSQAPAPSIHHPSSLVPFIPRSLKDASMVLVRHDGVKRPLQPPYDGPYPVLEAGDKVFKILRNGLPYTVSIDRLKPCNLPLTPPLSSIIPNRNPPPPHPDDPVSQVRTLPVRPPQVQAPPMTSFNVSAPVSAPSSTSDSSSPAPNITSETDFPPLGPPLITRSGRPSKPKVRLDL